MKIAVISFTENGRKLSEKISENLINVSRYCFYRHTDKNSVSFQDVYSLTGEIFGKYDALLFISACGIAVRAIAPHIKSKVSDPAVIVTDNCGKFVIPILSGHIGGANRISEVISEKINALPVITTATDTGGKFSPDSFAVANNLIISDMTKAKKIASAILEGEKTGITTSYRYINKPDEITENPCRTGMYIGTENLNPYKVTLQLIPKNIVLGIGCKKDTPYSIIDSQIKSVLSENGISLSRVCEICSADIKAQEKGIIKFCEETGVPFITYSSEQLMSLKGNFSSSEFVKSVTGTDNVCERSAVMSGGNLILKKTAGNGITVAAAEKNILLDFERKIL